MKLCETSSTSTPYRRVFRDSLKPILPTPYCRVFYLYRVAVALMGSSAIIHTNVPVSHPFERARSTLGIVRAAQVLTLLDLSSWFPRPFSLGASCSPRRRRSFPQVLAFLRPDDHKIVKV